MDLVGRRLLYFTLVGNGEKHLGGMFYLCCSHTENQNMKFGVVVFPGSNCDRDMFDALSYDLRQRS